MEESEVCADVIRVHSALIRNSINILGVADGKDRYGNTIYFVHFEFPYQAGDIPKRWTKQVLVMGGEMKNKDLYEQVYRYVQQLRDKLER